MRMCFWRKTHMNWKRTSDQPNGARGSITIIISVFNWIVFSLINNMLYYGFGGKELLRGDL